MKRKLKQLLNQRTLTTKIRLSFIIMVVPMFLISVLFLFYLFNMNSNFDEMVDSTLVSSEFSIDFKKDYDYETYLVIVENKSVDESRLDELLLDADRVVNGLEEVTKDYSNIRRLENIKKYLENLRTYKSRIEENLNIGNKYEENTQIWENDVQIVTTLVQDEMTNYIYEEVGHLQAAREQFQNSTMAALAALLIAYVIILIIVWLLAYYIPHTITRPITELRKVTDEVSKGNLDIRANIHEDIEVSALAGSFNEMIDKINELLSQVTEEQVRLRKAEFDLLQAQINPHFLYNTLDAIVWLAESGDHKKVVSMVKSLSDFFRTSLNHGKNIVTIKEELLHVKSYLDIQKVRYSDILEYEIDVPEELNNYLIPKITLQPLVENALYHGIKNKRGVGKIKITSRKEKDYFIISVTDDGIGMKEERLNEIRKLFSDRDVKSANMYGMYNVNERIILDFGPKYGINVDSEYQKGTVIEVRLPYNI